MTLGILRRKWTKSHFISWSKHQSKCPLVLASLWTLSLDLWRVEKPGILLLLLFLKGNMWVIAEEQVICSCNLTKMHFDRATWMCACGFPCLTYCHMLHIVISGPSLWREEESGFSPLFKRGNWGLHSYHHNPSPKPVDQFEQYWPFVWCCVLLPIMCWEPPASSLGEPWGRPAQYPF